MNIIESEKFRDRGKCAAEMLSKYGDQIGVVQRRDLLLTKKRWESHKRIEEATGIRFAVANDVDPGVAGFFAVDSMKAHIVESSLDDADFAEKVAHHEKGHERHERQGIRDISLCGNLKEEEYAALNGYMKVRGFDLDDIDLLEGFNEFGTAKEHGVNEDCAYNKKEVPAAEMLEKMCKRDTGKSLLEAFKSGNMDLFYELVRSLCAIIKLRKEFKMAS
jgi:hypothetical protein